MRDPFRASDPDRNFHFKRKWTEQPLRLETTQANQILSMISGARTLFAEGRAQQADELLSDAMHVVRQHRDRHHGRLRLEAGL